MSRLVGATLGILADLAVGWFVPLLAVALLGPLLSIGIAANPVVGGTTSFVIAAVLVWHTISHAMWWQLWVWLGALVPIGILSFIAPLWALYWVLLLQLIALGILFMVPGAVWPTARQWIGTYLLGSTVLTSVLAGGVLTGGMIGIIIMGLIALGAGVLSFSEAARPWEIRRAKRTLGRTMGTIGVILLVIGLIWPVVWRLGLPELSSPAPIKNMMAVVTASIEIWALKAERQLLGERAKTRSLEQMESELQRSHETRWRKLIEQVPSAPPSREEWQNLGVPQDP